MGNPRDYAAPGNQDPATPWPDSIVLASAIAAATTRLRIALAAVIYPLRHPLLLAKQLATLDLLSEGRLVVQPTVSWHEQEYEALGVPFHQRGAILDEQLEAMAAAWRDTPAAYAGAHFRFADVYLEPKPFRPEGPRMWFGGQSLHPALLRRLVRYGARLPPVRLADARGARATADGDGRGRPRRRRARDGRRHPRDVRRRDEHRRSRPGRRGDPGPARAGLHVDLLQALDVHRRHRRRSGRSAASSSRASRPTDDERGLRRPPARARRWRRRARRRRARAPRAHAGRCGGRRARRRRSSVSLRCPLICSITARPQ